MMIGRPISPSVTTLIMPYFVIFMRHPVCDRHVAALIWLGPTSQRATRGLRYGDLSLQLGRLSRARLLHVAYRRRHSLRFWPRSTAPADDGGVWSQKQSRRTNTTNYVIDGRHRFAVMATTSRWTTRLLMEIARHTSSIRLRYVFQPQRKNTRTQRILFFFYVLYFLTFIHLPPSVSAQQKTGSVCWGE